MLFTAIWGDCAVPLLLEDVAFRDWIERFLAIELRPVSGAGDEPPVITVRRTESGWEIDAPHGPRAAERDEDAAFLLFLVLGYEFQARTRQTLVHAGAFVNDGGAVVYLAGLRQGKSRLTFAAWRKGYAVLGDDRIALLFDDNAVRSLPRCLQLRLEDGHVHAAWRAGVPDDAAFIAELGGERRWILSRGLPGIVDCQAAVPIRAVALLRRVETGPTRLDEIPVSAVLGEALPYTELGAATPMDVLRFLNAHANGGRLLRLNVAPDEIDQALSLLARL